MTEKILTISRCEQCRFTCPDDDNPWCFKSERRIDNLLEIPEWCELEDFI